MSVDQCSRPEDPKGAAGGNPADVRGAQEGKRSDESAGCRADVGRWKSLEERYL